MAEADPGAGAGTRGASETGGDSAPGAVARPGAGRASTVAASRAPSKAAFRAGDRRPPGD